MNPRSFLSNFWGSLHFSAVLGFLRGNIYNRCDKTGKTSILFSILPAYQQADTNPCGHGSPHSGIHEACRRVLSCRLKYGKCAIPPKRQWRILLLYVDRTGIIRRSRRSGSCPSPHRGCPEGRGRSWPSLEDHRGSTRNPRGSRAASGRCRP